jgi:hypothetical protein
MRMGSVGGMNGAAYGAVAVQCPYHQGNHVRWCNWNDSTGVFTRACTLPGLNEHPVGSSEDVGRAAGNYR